MKMRRSGEPPGKIDIPMAPMIDVVFQLLTFFMLTLKIIEPEGDFNINMPIAAPTQSQSTEVPLPDIKVRLKAAPNGELASLELGRRSLGNDARAFDRLNTEILKIIGRPGNPLTKDMEVEIEADYNLHYQYVIRAVSACTGRMDPNTKRIVRYVEKIKFAPPKRPEGAGA